MLVLICLAKEENRRSCRDLGCHADAVCEQRGVEPFCVCKTGFRGDGKRCEPIGRFYFCIAVFI